MHTDKGGRENTRGRTKQSRNGTLSHVGKMRYILASVACRHAIRPCRRLVVIGEAKKKHGEGRASCKDTVSSTEAPRANMALSEPVNSCDKIALPPPVNRAGYCSLDDDDGRLPPKRRLPLVSARQCAHQLR
jgi:hypothetical protein